MLPHFLLTSSIYCCLVCIWPVRRKPHQYTPDQLGVCDHVYLKTVTVTALTNTSGIKLLDYGCGHLLKDSGYKEFAGWSGEALCGSLCFGLEAFELNSCSSRVSLALFLTPLRSGLIIVLDQLLFVCWV